MFGERAAYHVGAYDMGYEYVLLYLQGESSRANERLNQLEEEVRLLWANMRKTTFELHHLESKAQDAENNMNLVASQVETMAAIVTEQWIQIRQLEQALHNAEVQALTVKRLPTRSKFLKKLKGILDSSLFHKESPLGSYACQALHQLEKISSAAKKYHHELQGFIKQEMEKNEFTAALANKEVVFFVVSYCSFVLVGLLFDQLRLFLDQRFAEELTKFFLDPKLTLIPLPGFCSNYLSDNECLDVVLLTIQLAGSCQTVVLAYSNKSLAFLDFFSLLPLEMSMEGKMILTCPDWVSFNLISDKCIWIR
ncbi:hypothetical protein RHMOL_Rhmol02G0147200 [Rhododendron molle]|uniref:Uncharacterized protein n=1 Tax=Rhododendron molle TaxID=49168 RepID=A0ACC0PRH8_RHOML|nr:hypothetical protein RHMOL_Rhmol02G0147200 [Rhododendron molle]